MSKHCKKDNILHIEIYTNTPHKARYTVCVYGADGGMIKGTAIAGGEDFILPDGDYKITVQGDAFSSPREQQRWITLCGKESEQHFAISFVFGRICGNTASDMPLDCNRRNCAQTKPHHPCAPVQSPFQPSYYVRDWEKRNVKPSACPRCGKVHK